MAGRTFIMGDIHGAAKAMRQCLNEAEFDYDEDTLVPVGDYTDGFAEVFECIEELLKIKNLVPLMGYHDSWMLEFIQTEYHPAHWRYGGKGTLISYLTHSGKPGKYFAAGTGYKTALVSGDIPITHRHFFESLRPYYVDEKGRCFLHGGFNRHLPFYGQKESDYYWNRDLWEEALNKQTNGQVILDGFYAEAPFKEIFIGHTPTTKFGSDKPLKALNIINLDTGAGHSGRLTIMDVDTKQYWQSDPVTDLYSKEEMHRQSF